MEELVNSPLFGIILSLGAFEIGKFIYSKTKLPICNPLLITIIIIVGILLSFDIPLESYNKGGDIIVFFLAPATVVLAVPLYRQFNLLKSHFFPIMAGVLAGAITAVTSIIFIGKLLGMNMKLILSFVPKSITTPIGIELSKSLGGIPSVTVVGIIITGIAGAMVAPFVCDIFRIKNSVARGVGIGTASHSVGTTKAMDMGEVEGAMSGMSIVLAGIITIFITPLLVKLFL